MAHTGLLELLARSPGLSHALDDISAGKTPIMLVGAQGYAKLASVAVLAANTCGPAFLVMPGPDEAVTAKRDLSDLLGPDRVALFPAREVMPFETVGNQESLWMRLSTLAKLTELPSGSPLLVVLPATALIRRLMPPEEFAKGCLTVRRGDTVSPEALIRDLVGLGYEREFSVETRGQVALRGGILDVFPPASDRPYRLEFVYDEVESIRTFDPETQVSQDIVSEVFITPATDHFKIRDEKGSTVLDYAKGQRFVVVDAYERCKDALAEFERIGTEIASARIVAGTMGTSEASVYFPAAQVSGLLARCHVLISMLARFHETISIGSVIESDTSTQVGFSGRWSEFRREIEDLLEKKKRIVILAGNRDRRALLEKWLERQEIGAISRDSIDEIPEPGLVTLSLGSGENGFNCDDLDLALFTETEVYGRTVVRQRRQRRSKATLDWRELSPGDYVVHANHGIGQFMGLKTMTVNGVTRDYLHLRYAGGDALYVPIDQVDMVERYVGPEGKPPGLQRLGTGDWQKVKARVKASLEDMARKLVMLEARRKSRRGVAFSPDTPWQRQFEEGFEYEDTEDQARATLEIKHDMEQPVPMDRLLCGDVGYGKTEVAMRCAFKAVMDSKQVAVLVPTTILAEQHFSTFTRRFSDYPVSIKCLSRFRSASEQRKIIQDVAMGAVDILIGTHRLLSKDVSFKDLGLLIIDEEHRFGVAQKERLKQLSETCDVLTLTATPIPRTLNMALSGLRDISVIETPPEGRFPVETYVVAANPSLISQAIRREMRRGGQVFYVYNRVRSIARVYQRVQSLVPEARIAVAHGKMREHELSITMQDFLQGRYDVLISTTIIESGLDLPNVNTLIVEDADKLGLAQLYQLRGRVGRSNRIAYAYFTYRHDRSMTFTAEERLAALRDFTTMGSGFKLAMRDMEIRGAGNLLGREQHGFMHLVGYEMYLNLLEKAVRSLRGEKEERVERILTAVEIPCDAYLPESYVESPKERYAIYRSIAGANDEEAIDATLNHLRDRYGPVPKPAENLLKVARMRILSGKLGITQVTQTKGDLTFGRERLTLKIEVPHLFPAARLPQICKEFPGLDLDSRQSMLSLPIPKNNTSLDLGLALVGHLSLGE
ncbi:MAG: transcription-repair coupling factor [Bacillota bacterium]|jgi:transcription-repair coupling factor (superfamily II helicase)